jgi:nucleoside-diphosphate-sugar epimerase
MKILLTGAGGQIGHDLIGALVAQGHAVISTDLAPRPPSHAHAEGVDWQRLDVTDAAAVQHTFTDVRPDIVFHLAAILSATGEANPRLAYDVNQTGTWNVLESCRRAKVGRLIFTSSIAVFGPPPSGPLPDPCPDDVALHPSTMYGVTKVSGELLCAYYRSRYGIDCRGVRFPGLISAAMPGGGSSDYALFMYVDAVRKGGYEAFARADTRIPLMYMPAHDVQHRRVLAARRRDRDVREARHPERQLHVRARSGAPEHPRQLAEVHGRHGRAPRLELESEVRSRWHDRRPHPSRAPHARAGRDPLALSTRA